jgi:hypothetical protein
MTGAKRRSGNVDAGADNMLFPVVPGLNADRGEAGLLYLSGGADSTDLSRPITRSKSIPILCTDGNGVS